MKYRVSSVPGLNRYLVEKRIFPMVWVPVSTTVYDSYDEAQKALEALS